MDLFREAGRRAAVYQRLAAFYAGDLAAGREAATLLGELQGQEVSLPCLAKEDEHDYNRLFVGPQKLLAPPLESCYRNDAHLPMQAETLAVRAAYEAAGIELKEQGRIPDDHAQFEFCFAAALLTAMERYADQEQGPLAAWHYQRFLREHLLLWIFDHLQAVTEHSCAPFCREMAHVMDRFMKREEEAVSHEI
ncbi:chaperone TorD involved in molybdoenzyme TorA maturation [Selenomonas sp. GACV-9]|uniref:TorD/DmsD family molecular chaperone n=1 Tax=Selenomonas sp. GACV-9 TaxID=3158782 RepID=UPI0008E4AF5E|nr:chaperone TorD involved in molybdoenzyme TorA maturation [Selenomonas ruminantium]